MNAALHLVCTYYAEHVSAPLDASLAPSLHVSQLFPFLRYPDLHVVATEFEVQVAAPVPQAVQVPAFDKKYPTLQVRWAVDPAALHVKALDPPLQAVQAAPALKYDGSHPVAVSAAEHPNLPLPHEIQAPSFN